MPHICALDACIQGPYDGYTECCMRDMACRMVVHTAHSTSSFCHSINATCCHLTLVFKCTKVGQTDNIVSKSSAKNAAKSCIDSMTRSRCITLECTHMHTNIHYTMHQNLFWWHILSLRLILYTVHTCQKIHSPTHRKPAFVTGMLLHQTCIQTQTCMHPPQACMRHLKLLHLFM